MDITSFDLSKKLYLPLAKLGFDREIVPAGYYNSVGDYQRKFTKTETLIPCYSPSSLFGLFQKDSSDNYALIVKPDGFAFGEHESKNLADVVALAFLQAYENASDPVSQG